MDRAINNLEDRADAQFLAICDEGDKLERELAAMTAARDQALGILNDCLPTNRRGQDIVNAAVSVASKLCLVTTAKNKAVEELKLQIERPAVSAFDRERLKTLIADL